MLTSDEWPEAATRCSDAHTWSDKTLLMVTNKRILWAKEVGGTITPGEIKANDLRKVSRTTLQVVFHQTDKSKTVFYTWRSGQIQAVVTAAKTLIGKRRR
jgi:hypothetical protein